MMGLMSRGSEKKCITDDCSIFPTFLISSYSSKHQFWDQVEKNLLQNLLSSKDSPPRFSCLLLIGRIFLSAVTDWADIFYPRFLIGRIFIRVPMPAPSHHREICSKSTLDFSSDSIASRYFNFFGWIQKFSIVSIRNKRYHSTSKVLIYLYWISELL